MIDAGDNADPRGLIREAYSMEGLGPGECRSIFLDWALGLPAGSDPRALIPALIALHGAAAPDHPMTQVLRAGLDASAPTGRRGGWAARRGLQRQHKVAPGGED
ncbi:MAG: hypothetical protein CVT80_07935 [Alphaproteobacteria bacterium HGW-Alphaproteobacteria-2]|nr:MAG: hypothetical protein CVT80_07935 [Alphaproteobacteria bacterium HGW-Alphaproteobacteria-2]